MLIQLPHGASAKVVPVDDTTFELHFGQGEVRRFSQAINISPSGVVSAADGDQLPESEPDPAAEAWLDQPGLSFGSRGDRVRELQQLLNDSDAVPPLVVDGDFGPSTLSAVKSFQGREGLQVDGLVGPATWAALGGQGPLPTIRSQGPAVPQVPATGGV